MVRMKNHLLLKKKKFLTKKWFNLNLITWTHSVKTVVTVTDYDGPEILP
jgi:hypothetical protein